MGYTLNALLMKPLMLMRRNIEWMARALDVDTYSKKLKLNNHLDIMVAQTMEGCNSLKEISVFTKANGRLTSISSGQLSW
jgi:hypothetical protein